MVKLTPELIEDSFQYMNPLKEYELNLRGLKISLLENLGATLNQFDTIDFTDNDIRKLDGFPVLSKLKSLLFSNNRIQHIAKNLEQFIPNLETLILTNNNVDDLHEIDNLSSLKSLKHLSLMRNPVASFKHYRLYTIYRIPNLKILDFKKIKQAEREEAQKTFKGKKLKSSDQASKPKTYTPGEPLQSKQTTNAQAQKNQPTKEEIEAIRLAIQEAKTFDEVEQLNAILKSGMIPQRYQKNPQKTANNTQNQMETE